MLMHNMEVRYVNLMTYKSSIVLVTKTNLFVNQLNILCKSIKY
jgi:hypothetical protein